MNATRTLDNAARKSRALLAVVGATIRIVRTGDMMKSQRIAHARRMATLNLYGIARPHFNYPMLSRSMWYLPIVHVWEPWYGHPGNRTEDKLWGALIVPSIVAFPLQPPTVHSQITSDDVANFRADLRRLTGDEWHADDNDLGMNVVVAVRLSLTLHKRTTTATGGYTKSTRHVPFNYEVPDGWWTDEEWEEYIEHATLERMRYDADEAAAS
jgi:hypothetical protein